MSLHRRAAARDANEPEIRKAFAAHGWHTEQVSGTGMPDLIAWPPDGQRAWSRGCPSTALVEVKMPKGALKPAQEEKWGALREKGISVYVVRTVEDVAALVRGELAAWEPSLTTAQIKRGVEMLERTRATRCGQGGCRALRPCRLHDVGGTRSEVPLATVTADAGKRLTVVREPGSGLLRAPRANVVHPNDGRPVLAQLKGRAQEAEVLRRLEAGEPVYGNPKSGYIPPRSKPVDAAKEAEETFAPGPRSANPACPFETCSGVMPAHVKQSVAVLCDGGCGARLWTKAKGAVKARQLCAACRATPKPGYIPPRSKPVDAAKEAEETFAPPLCALPGCVHGIYCPARQREPR